MSPPATIAQPHPDAAWQDLIDGNARFVAGRLCISVRTPPAGPNSATHNDHTPSFSGAATPGWRPRSSSIRAPGPARGRPDHPRSPAVPTAPGPHLAVGHRHRHRLAPHPHRLPLTPGHPSLRPERPSTGSGTGGHPSRRLGGPPTPTATTTASQSLSALIMPAEQPREGSRLGVPVRGQVCEGRSRFTRSWAVPSRVRPAAKA